MRKRFLVLGLLSFFVLAPDPAQAQHWTSQFSLMEDTESITVADNGSIWVLRFHHLKDADPCRMELIRKGSRIRLDVVARADSLYGNTRVQLRARKPLRPGPPYHLRSKCPQLEASILTNEAGEKVQFHGMAGVDLVKPVWHGEPKIKWQGRHCPACGNDLVDFILELDTPVTDGSELRFESMTWRAGTVAMGDDFVTKQPLWSGEERRLYFNYAETLEGECHFLLVCAIDAAENRSCATPVPFVPMRRDWESECGGDMGEYVSRETRADWRDRCEAPAGQLPEIHADEAEMPGEVPGWKSRLSVALGCSFAFLLAAWSLRRRRKRSHRGLGGLGIHRDRSD